MDGEKWKEVCAIVQRIKNKKWAKEMDDVKIVVVNRKWRSKLGQYDYMKKPPRIAVSGLRTVLQIERTIYHEIAHHIEHGHVKGFIRYRGVIHSTNFHIIFRRLLNGHNSSLKEIIDKLCSYPRNRSGWEWNKTKTKFVFINMRYYRGEGEVM